MGNETLTGWLTGRIPDDWFDGPVEIDMDRDEVLVLGRITDVDAGEGASEAQREAARAGRIRQFREDTRQARMRIAREIEHRFGRKVAWGAEIGDQRELFTTLSVPVMTRLRLRERKVLDTLVDAGVARSRSHALAWCVRLVAEKQEEWLNDLQEAMVSVQKVRAEGPIS